MSTGKARRLIERTIDGVEALVNTESGEIFIDIPAVTPRYISAEEGDVLREGDVRSRKQNELDSPTLRKWTITEIRPDAVVGTDQETGERHEWERESLEKQLAVGGLSTNLTSFDRMSVVSGVNPTQARETSEESIVVVLYGNDGRTFTQTYQVDGADGDERLVELLEPDKRAETFEPILRKRFDQAIEHALRTEGYRSS